MKKSFLKTGLLITLVLTLVTFFNFIVFAEEGTSTKKHGTHFVDANGDGYNDNAPDHDGDGIPNGQDPDYKKKKGCGGGGCNNFVDKNGDGYNDNAADHDGDGIPNGLDPDFKKGCGNGQKLSNGHGCGNGNGHGQKLKKNCTDDCGKCEK